MTPAFALLFLVMEMTTAVRNGTSVTVNILSGGFFCEDAGKAAGIYLVREKRDRGRDAGRNGFKTSVTEGGYVFPANVIRSLLSFMRGGPEVCFKMFHLLSKKCL